MGNVRPITPYCDGDRPCDLRLPRHAVRAETARHQNRLPLDPPGPGRDVDRHPRRLPSRRVLHRGQRRPLTDWFTARWANRAPATWNRNLDAVRAAARYWMDQGWINSNPSRRLRRRGRAPDRTRALPCGDVVDFLAREVLELRLKVKGPLFLTDRKARVHLAAADLDPESGRARLSYRRGIVHRGDCHLPRRTLDPAPASAQRVDARR